MPRKHALARIAQSGINNNLSFSQKKKLIPVLAVSLLLVLFSLSPFGKNETEAAGNQELLTSGWKLAGNNGAAESYQSISSTALKDVSALEITYDLHGLCALSGDASAVIFDQPDGWKYISLSNYGKNCYNGSQTVSIPMSNFKGIDTTRPVGTLHSRFWYGGNFNVDITSIKTVGSTTGTTPVQPQPTTAPQPNNTFKGEYWNNPNTLSSPSFPSRSPDLTRTENAVDYNWNYGSPDAKINSDHFIARWTKVQTFNAGNYRFTSTSDDGIRVWLDNDLLIDQWTDHAPKNDGADRFIAAGNHTVKVEYYENSGGSVIKLNVTPITAGASTPTPQPVNSAKSWDIQSVSSMKESKDRICSQPDRQYIERWVDKAKELGVNYVAVETPYDSPACADTLSYTKTWIDVVRSRGLKVWHRHMFLSFEGIYNTPKNSNADYMAKISQYIKNNPSFFAPGDIFTPQPEPQNGGISGFSYCDQGVCMFKSISHFNQWLRDAIDTSENAFKSIGLGSQMRIGYYGFDGFVAWGSNNPDWHGILEDATVQKMGNITVDHYPELIGQTMKQGLDELQARYPNTPIIIGEWGSAGTTDVQSQVINSMSAAKRPEIVGFNYWHMGMGGNEALINSDFTNRSQFDEVQSFFLGKR